MTKTLCAFVILFMAATLFGCGTGPSNSNQSDTTQKTTPDTVHDSASTPMLHLEDSSVSNGTIASYLKKETWVIEGVPREALVAYPVFASLHHQLVFAFHGHGGTDSQFSHKSLETYLQTAIVVYPQGLLTKSGQDVTARNTGWQHSVGEVNSHTGIKDQDLKFFDAMMKTFKPSIDTNLVFVHGWSNGGEFAYNVLWEARDKQIAAICGASSTVDITGKTPKAVMHIAGTQDPLVNFTGQKNSIDKVRTLNRCNTGYVWATGNYGLNATRYPSAIGRPVIFLQYDSGHSYTDNVPVYIMKFFTDMTTKILK